MTVSELIDILTAFPSDATVVIPCYYDTETPDPKVVIADFKVSYWDAAKITNIAVGETYVELL